MKKLLVIMPLLFVMILGCSNPNECELTEQFSPSITKFVKDQGHKKYDYLVTFKQFVQIYSGDCAAEKNVNQTSVQITSKAPCDQTLRVQIFVDLGDASYNKEWDAVEIQAGETVDLGIVNYGGPRIDFANIVVNIFTELCPGDE